MKALLGDSKTFRDGLLHYLLAGVVFAGFLGGSVSFIILFLMRRNALFLFQGMWGILIEAAVTWFSVWLSSRVINRNREHDAFGVALIATGFACIVSLAEIPYLHFFSEMARSTETYLIVKEALHVCLFYTSTLLYFSGTSTRSLLTE